MDHVSIDCATLNCASDGETYILILIDYFTKFVWIRALSDKKMTTIAKTLWNIFSNFSLPRIIQSDNGSEFVNHLIKKLVAATNMDHRLTTPYYPQANGSVERTVRTVLNSIKKQLQGCNTTWTKFVEITRFGLYSKISFLIDLNTNFPASLSISESKISISTSLLTSKKNLYPSGKCLTNLW